MVYARTVQRSTRKETGASSFLFVHSFVGAGGVYLLRCRREAHRVAEVGADGHFGKVTGGRILLHFLDLAEVQESIRRIEGKPVRALHEARDH
jgi:DNA-binding IclR family transcriptional regulator